MLEDLKLSDSYDGFLFLADSARNPPVLKPHHHVELELNLVRRGSVTYVVSGQRHRFSQGTLLWMFPTQEHQLVHRTDDAQYYVAVFKPALIDRACRNDSYRGLKQELKESDGVLHAKLDTAIFDLLCQTMEELLRESLDPDLLNREAGFGLGSDFRFEHGDPVGLNAGLQHILLQSWRQQNARQEIEGAVVLHPAVESALVLLNDPDCEPNLGQLARQCGVSDTYLSRLFGLQVGVSMSRYRNSVRLNRFIEIFRSRPHCTMTEAVYAAGFGSYAQFYKVFVQAYGRGPREALASRKGM